MVVLALLLSSVAIPADVARDARQVARALEIHYRRASTLEGVFLERYSDGRGAMRVESGRVYFSRPGRMRWEYESPEKKLFLVDGTNVWFYIPADRTASRARVKESTDWRTPLALLAGKANLFRLCGRLELASAGAAGEDRPTKAGNSVLSCLPRNNSEKEAFREVLLEVNPESQLVRVLIREPGNIETEFRFGAWKENLPLPETKFHFQPPPGVAIVDQASLAAEMR